MKPITEKLDMFISNWSFVPLLSEVFSIDKLLIILDISNRYQITEEEGLKIKDFPFDFVKSTTRLSFEVEYEIDLNIERRIETEFHLKNYLQSIDDRMYYITDCIRDLNFIDQLENNRFFLPNLTGFNEQQVENSNLLIDFLQFHLINYQNYQMVQNHIIKKQQEFGFLASFKESAINGSGEEINMCNSNHNLKSQFNNGGDRYDEIIKKLSTANILRKDKEDNLLFMPISRKNALYEAVTLFEALNSSGFLTKRNRSYGEIGTILSNTFKGWNLSVRTIGDKKTHVLLKEYEDIIN